MSALSISLPLLLLAQAEPLPTPPTWLLWLFTWGEPAVTISGPLGGVMTWIKVLGLFCLLGWLLAWLVTAVKDQSSTGRTGVLDLLALGGLIAGGVATFLGVLVSTGQLIESLRPLPVFLGVASGIILLIWLEAKLWSILRRQGTGTDLAVLVAMHMALGLGFVVSFLLRGAAANQASVLAALIQGGRLGATYMGFVVLLRVVSLVLPEVSRLRARRLYAIAWHSWTEAFRRMWAPWVVIVLFAVVLAFTSWFLQPSREAELSRLYVGTLMLLSSILLTFTIVILAPISLPNDIRQQTIFTIVSKPTRRLELVWGRVLGYMALVTVLMLFFAGVSLIYFSRMVGAAIADRVEVAERYERENKTELAQQAREQASQLRTRMSARQPVYGALIFFDSRGDQKRQGIDVGLELPRRSFVEGATPSRALWRFGPEIPNPYNPQEVLRRPIAVEAFLVPSTIEWLDNQIFNLQDDIVFAQQEMASPNVTSARNRELNDIVNRSERQIETLQAQLDNMRKREQTLKAQNTPEAETEANALHSPPIPIEMTFTVYRTTKGELGDPVYASMIATNPRPGARPFNAVFPIREYYTNQRTLPSSLLVGSRGQLTIEVRCLSPNQYLGMAEDDLFLVASQGSFWTNYVRGLLGIWLQALILTAIGVFAGTFLSWPVALLATVFFFVAGNVGFQGLQAMALSSDLVGGGPFESLIRMLSHDNLVSELAPTPGVIVAQTLDSVVMPVMSRLVYLVPNFAALDVSDTVAAGFAVPWARLGQLVLLALAYAIPFSIAGYFILRNREVAA